MEVKKIKLILGLIYLVVLFLFLYVLFSNFSVEEITSYKFIQSNREYLNDLKKNNLIVISLYSVLFSILWVLLLGLASPLALFGGFMFGKWLGTFLVIIGCSLGATIFYLFGLYFFSDLIKKYLSPKYGNLESKFKKKEFIFFLIYRFIGGIPFLIGNLLPVLFHIKLRNYFFGTLLGIAPQIFVIVSLGSGLEKILSLNQEPPSILEILKTSEIYLPILAFLIIIFLAFLTRKIFYKF